MTRLPNLDDYDNEPTEDDPADKPNFNPCRYEIPRDEEAEESRG